MQIPAGTKIIIKGGSFSGALPSSCEFSDGAAVTATGSNCAVVFQTGYAMPSGSTLTLIGGSLTASTCVINGALVCNNVSTTITTSATVGGSLTCSATELDLAVPTITKTAGGSVAISCKNASGTSWQVDSLTTAEDASITTLIASGAVDVGGDASGTTWTTGDLTVDGLFSVPTLVLNGASTVSLDSVTSLTLGASGAITIAEDATLASLATSAGASITFPTSEFVKLIVTTSATFSGATTLSGKAYVALPSGASTTNLTTATGADVRIGDYGAGVTRLDASVDQTTGTITCAVAKTDSTKSVLTEVLVDDVWTLLSSRETSTSFTTSARGTQTNLRVWDGASFVTTSVYCAAPHVWLTYVDKHYATQIASSYDTEVDYIMSSDYSRAGESILLMGRAQLSGTSTLLTSADISSIKYTCSKITHCWGAKTRTAVTGHSAVTVPNNCLLSALVTTDSRWTKDSTGYNFLYEPDTTTNPIFPSEGQYEIVVTITPTSGNPVPLVFDVEAY